LTLQKEWFILLANPTKKKKEVENASILCEMPRQKGNERCKSHNYEEREAGNPGRMSRLRHEDVPYREELKLILSSDLITKEAGYLSIKNVQPHCFHRLHQVSAAALIDEYPPIKLDLRR